MTEILLVKSTLLLFAAGATCLALRKRSAAARHLVWLCALGALLILPAGMLLPPAGVTLPAIAADAMERTDINALTPSVKSLKNTVFAAWLCGVLLLLIRIAVDFARAARLIQSAHPGESHGAYSVAFSHALAGPVAWGIGSRRMLLPEAARGWDAERLRVVLLHETGHLRRNDCWALLTAEVACSLYWCNPLVWFAAAQLRREQEQAVDDEVLNSGVDAAAYANHLLAIAKIARTPKLAAGAFGQSGLAIRIEAILDPRRNRAMVSKHMMVASIVGLLAIALPVASMQAGRKIYTETDSGVVKPRPIEKHNPKYTDEAREAKIEGSVKLSAVIDIDGKARDIKVEQGIDEGLEENAVAAVQTWRFEPAQKAGEPVPFEVKIEINFSLL